MADNDIETVIVGGGAAGIAAGRRLKNAGVKCLIVEARPRLGGRAWTITDPSGFPIDLGCGWLHSADRNPWVAAAEEQRKTIDKTPPPWRRLSLPTGFPVGWQKDFLMSQEDLLATTPRIAGMPAKPEEALTDAEAALYQVRIRDLAALTGLDFGPLAAGEVTVGDETLVGPVPITKLEDVKIRVRTRQGAEARGREARA